MAFSLEYKATMDPSQSKFLEAVVFMFIRNLVVHAFYSRSSQINNAVGEHIQRLSEPPSSIVFAITFDTDPDGRNNGIPMVVLLVNGNEIVRFDPRHTEDQSLTLKHTLKYTNETLHILEGSDVAGAFIDVNF